MHRTAERNASQRMVGQYLIFGVLGAYVVEKYRKFQSKLAIVCVNYDSVICSSFSRLI